MITNPDDYRDLSILKEISYKEKALAIASHISYLFLGIGFVIIPLVICFATSDGKYEWVQEQAAIALEMQVLVTFLIIAMAVVSIVTNTPQFIFIACILATIYLGLSIYCAFKCFLQDNYRK